MSSDSECTDIDDAVVTSSVALVVTYYTEKTLQLQTLSATHASSSQFDYEAAE